MKKSISISVAAIFLLSGCVKLELGDVVSDTVDVGRDLYQTIKRKSNDEEERIYSHSLPSESESNDLVNITKCNAKIEEMIGSSGVTLREVLSRSSEILDNNGSRQVKCILTVVVKE